MGTLPSGTVNLALDLGNSSAKAGVFHGERLTDDVLRFGYSDWSVTDEWVTNHGVENIVYSSVANVPPPEVLDKWKQEGRLVFPLKATGSLPFPSRYRTPATLGQDRIAAIMGAIHDPALPTDLAPAASQYSDTSADIQPGKLIVDAGTCMTTDVVDSSGMHLGGNISPGIRMRLRAMHEFTARLPLPELTIPQGEVGRSTEEALLHGAQLGAADEVAGLYRRLTATQPRLKLILTGGDAATLASHLSITSSLRPHLVLRGLIKILSLYVTNES